MAPMKKLLTRVRTASRGRCKSMSRIVRAWSVSLRTSWGRESSETMA
jgi:hypothetical protein